MLAGSLSSYAEKRNRENDCIKKIQPVISHSMVKLRPWHSVQEQVRDTVVQVFSQVAQFDWFQPYRTPMPQSVRGSGFFISDDGKIITNAHVVDQAVAIWIQIPSLGKRPIKAHVIGVCPEKDIALLKLDDEELSFVKKTLGKIPYLVLGNSDNIYRADEVLALGYPLGQESLKSTTGIVSGHEQHWIQISAAINPGSSGGPLINDVGEVVGINSAGITEAQNVGYAIPINVFRVILPDLHQVKMLRRPFLGILTIKVTDHLTTFLKNPLPGGCYVVEVVKNSPLEKAGIQAGDMIYEVNGFRLDIYGEMNVPWSEDKISIIDYVNRLAIGQIVDVVAYRNGERKEFTSTISWTEYSPIHKIYPWYEAVEYEVFAGMVIMPLTVNHIKLIGKRVPGLMRYSIMNYQTEPVLLVSHLFPNSEIAQARTISPGFTLNAVNGEKVNTLEDFRKAIKKSSETGYVHFKMSDQITCTSDNIPVVLPLQNAVNDTIKLSRMYRYPISDMVKELQEIIKS